MDELLVPILIAAFIMLIVVLGIYGWMQEKKRREALRLLAEKLGFQYHPGQDRTLPMRFAYLAQMDDGENRYAENVFSGTWEERTVRFFDYHYETYSTDSKGNRQTHHHYYSIYLCKLEREFPELRIYPENILSKIGQTLGYGDIDFESVEFSKAFTVRSPDKKFAYDICHGKMMEFLLQHRGATVEIERDTLAMVEAGRLRPEDVEGHLERLVAIRTLIPGYLFDAGA